MLSRRLPVFFRAAASTLLLCQTPTARAMASFGADAPPPVITHAADSITIAPRAPHSALVVVMHGLGDTADGFADVAQMWHSMMPYAKFVLPTAPTQPVTMNGGMAMPSWYDIEGLSERTNEKCEGIVASRARIQALLDQVGRSRSTLGETLGGKEARSAVSPNGSVCMFCVCGTAARDNR